MSPWEGCPPSQKGRREVSQVRRTGLKIYTCDRAGFKKKGGKSQSMNRENWKRGETTHFRQKKNSPREEKCHENDSVWEPGDQEKNRETRSKRGEMESWF